MIDAKPCPFCGSTPPMVAAMYCSPYHSPFESIEWGDEDARLDVPAFFKDRR